jgi:hypothetical protein
MFCLELDKIASFFNSDVLDRQISIDELVMFKLCKENQIYLQLIRYIILTIELKLKDSVELHPPRNSKEFFTYNSDKYWSKLIYALRYINKKNEIAKNLKYAILLHYIHVGGYVNIHKYWHVHLSEKGYMNNTIVVNDIDYHYSTTYRVLNKSIYDVNLVIDKIITKCLFDIREYIYSDDDTVYYYMLKHMLDENTNNINKNFVSKFKNYLNTPYSNPSSETENKLDMLNLIYDIL